MFTSSAEYRLILRQDNADLRLMEFGNKFGLIEREFIVSLKKKLELINDGIIFLKSNTASPKDINSYLECSGSSPLAQNEFISNIVKRTEVKLLPLLEILNHSGDSFLTTLLESPEAINQIEIDLKYEGYITRQNELVESFNRNESIRIPDDFKYERIKSISTEALDKLNKVKPKSIGQALRIAGVRPSDISAILIFMRG
jgi:tRNA uridine 5-carboxymethylaminomethyl modification enzyme